MCRLAAWPALLGLLALLLAALSGAAAAASEVPVAPADNNALLPNLVGLKGPTEASVIVRPPDTDWRLFEHGEASRLAILLSGPDPGAWLGLVEGLRALGVPVTVTRDWQEAARHAMVVVYPGVSGRWLDPAAMAGLRAVAERGGTLLGFNVSGTAWTAAFGVQEAQPSRSRISLRFDAAGREPRETEVPLGSRDHPELGLWTFAHPADGASVLAHFDNGDPALLDLAVGSGHLYVLGVDVGDLALRGFNNRQDQIARSYVNQYEPAVDVLLHWIKARYREAVPHAVTLATAPQGRQLPVMISHDIDYFASLRNAQAYLAYEREAGIRTTYFVQTKYVNDWEDRPFLDADSVALIRALARGGMEIGSHSVAHSRVFHHMPLGSGEERFPDYRPVVPERKVCEGCSVFGELRISRFLLTQLVGTAPESFRSGHLLNPPFLPEALVASGYRYASDSTANDLLTHLPVHAHFGRGSTASLPLFEFPVSIEDEEKPPLGERIGPALTLAEQIARDEGILVVLIHPNVTGHKLRFEQALVQGLQGRAWFGSIGDFGHWWSARDQVEVDIREPAAEGAAPAIHLRAQAPIEGLTLQLPAGASVPVGGLVRSCSESVAVLGRLEGEAELPLQLP